MEFTKWLMSFPALTVMLLLRSNLGYRLLNPLALFGVSFAMAVIATWAAETTPYADALMLFAGLVFIGGIAERAKRWRELRRGMRLHSYYIGDSHLQRLKLPGFLRRNRRVERFIDPLICLLAGFPLVQFIPALGGWILFSGLCLRIVEDAVWKKQIERDLDTLDGMIESEVQEEVLEQYSVRIHQPSQGQGEGIPTGYAADVQKTILRRTTKRVPRRE